MRTVTNYFIVNLSLADVLVTITCLPATLVVDITETWFFGQPLCKVIPYLQVTPFYAFWLNQKLLKKFSIIVPTSGELMGELRKKCISLGMCKLTEDCV